MLTSFKRIRSLIKGIVLSWPHAQRNKYFPCREFKHLSDSVWDVKCFNQDATNMINTRNQSIMFCRHTKTIHYLKVELYIEMIFSYLNSSKLYNQWIVDLWWKHLNAAFRAFFCHQRNQFEKWPALKFSTCSSRESPPLIKRSNPLYCPAAVLTLLVSQTAPPPPP